MKFNKDVTPDEFAKLNKLLSSFEKKEVKKIGNNVQDLMYAAKLAEHIQQLEDFSGHLKYFKPDGPLSIEKYPRHRMFFDATAKHKEVLFMAGNRVGKEVRISEPVLTPDGWKPIGELKEGDEVCDPNGLRVKVSGVFDQGLKDIYRVWFNDGSYVDCGLDHQWKCKSPRARFVKEYTRKGRQSWKNASYGEWEVKSLKDIIEHVGYEPKPRRRYSIPVVSALSFNDKELTIEPYFLGLLLGDGSLSVNSVGITSADQEIVDYCAVQAVKYDTVLKHNGKYGYRFSSRLRDAGGRNHSKLVDAVRELGLAGKTCHDKFIPEQYKHHSRRLEILQGLMDTDGYCGNKVCEFSSTSEQLAKDVADICRSLGIRCTIKKKQTSCRYKGEKKIGTAYRVSIWTTDVPLFRLTRKAKKQVLGAKKNGSENVIVKIEKVGQDYARCIEVDSEDHTYVISNYVVTHNSLAGAYCTACWTTGIYPDWWKGRVFRKNIKVWACADRNNTFKESVQETLLGKSTSIGTGMLPMSRGNAPGIVDIVTKPNTGGMVDLIVVKSDMSKQPSIISSRTYEQGVKAFYGAAVDAIWEDEESDSTIHNECLLRTMTTQGIVILTYTPLHGLTPLTLEFKETATLLTEGMD